MIDSHGGGVVSRNCPALAIGSSIEDTRGCNQVRARACGIDLLDRRPVVEKMVFEEIVF